MDAERRHASVLFADVSGFTRMGGAMDPEDLRDVMNRCFALLEAAVLEHGGHPHKYEGDCLMALFGAPQALEASARAAVNAAIAMRRVVREERDRGGLPAFLDIHTGINTGVVVTGHSGGRQSGDWDVIGDTVNLAARLKDASPEGAVWVGGDTYRFTAREFDYAPLPRITLKNVERPFAAYELRSVVESRARGTLGSRLVGRDAEVGELVEAVQELESGAGGVLRIIGDAGLGKSRLMGEIEGVATRTRVIRLAGRCVPVGTTLRWHPFVDILRGWAGIDPATTPEAAVQAIRAACATVLGEAADAASPLLATMLGLPLEGEDARRVETMSGDALEKLIGSALRDVLEGLSRQRPVLVQIEDVHWADESSVELLTSLLRVGATHPVLFVLSARPDDPAVTGPLRRLGAGARDVVLPPLTPRQSDVLVQNLLGAPDVPAAIRAEIVARSEGNPFYLEEIVRGLLDAGILERTGSGVVMARPVEHVRVPGSIEEIIIARLERLPDDARQLVQLLGVIGRSARQDVIAEVAQREVQALGEMLRDLAQRDLVESRRVGDDTEWVFRHALIQETVYNAISLRVRRDMHRRVAEVVERRYAGGLDEFFGMLAWHYSQAKETAKAEEYLFKAGAEAARVAASAEALTFFREAARLYLEMHGDGGDPLRRAELEKSIGLALLNRGQLLECIGHFEAALLLLGEPVPRTRPRLYARLAADMATLLFRVWRSGGRPPSGRRVARGNVDLLLIRYNCNRAQTTSDTERGFFDSVRTLRLLTGADHGRVAEACGMYAGGAALFAFSGLSFSLSQRFLRMAEAIARSGDVRDQFVLRSYRFLVRYFEGTWRDEDTIDDAMVEEALRHGQAWDVNTYLGLHCEQAIVQGRFARAEADLRLLDRMVDRYGYEFARSNSSYMPAYLLLQQRDVDGARKALAQYYEGRHEDALVLLALATRARLELLAGERDAAEESLREAAAIDARLGLVAPYYRATLAASRLLLDVAAVAELDPHDVAARRRLAKRATRSLREAVRWARVLARERPQVMRLAGQLQWLRGDARRALRSWGAALSAAQALGARPEGARIALDIARALESERAHSAEHQGRDAAAWRTFAAQEFAELGLRRELDAVRSDGGRLAQRADS